MYFFQELPDVLEKLTPTLREIRKAVTSEGEISDKQLLKWGRDLLSQGKHFARQAKSTVAHLMLMFRIAIKSIQNMPIEQLIAVSEEHDLQSKVPLTRSNK